MAKLLLVEDEFSLADALIRALRDEQHVVESAKDGEDGYYLARRGGHDLVILDLMVPSMNGIEVCRKLRREGFKPPILMITARDAVDDVVGGLDAGANDYLRKPFAIEEFLARVRALLRADAGADDNVTRAGAVTLDLAKREVKIGGEIAQLSRKEFAVLECLMRNRGRVISKETIAEKLWELGDEPESNAIEVYISTLRKKVETDGSKLIHTQRGFGYVIKKEED
ncbi:MAG: response regulator transcription factor [Planctomycetes bacterium]|nr:response regulator transcription factor [Planctomycetota bacterium]